MKTKIILVAALGLMFSLQSFAQESDSVNLYQSPHAPKVKKRNGIPLPGKEEKTVIIIENGKVTVNGKPVEDMKGTLKGDEIEVLGMPSIEGMMSPKGNFMFSMPQNNKAILGVTTENNDKEAKVISVTKASPAEKAGLKEGDIITKVDTFAITNPDDLHDAIGKYKPEDKVNITYLRGTDAENTVTVKLDKNKEMQAFAFSGKDFNGDVFGQNFGNGNRAITVMGYPRPRLGLQVQDLEEGNGVKVTEINDDGPAAKAGLKENDIIKSINGTEIKNVDDVRTKIKGLKEGDAYKIKYTRNGKDETAEIRIPKKLKKADL